MQLKKRRTARGFGYVEFEDAYGVLCTLQESSLASNQGHIWFGSEEPRLQIMKSDAVRLKIPVEQPIEGWQPYEIPEEVMVDTRAHLSQDDVAALLPVLQHFVETGDVLTAGQEEDAPQRAEDPKTLDNAEWYSPTDIAANMKKASEGGWWSRWMLRRDWRRYPEAYAILPQIFHLYRLADIVRYLVSTSIYRELSGMTSLQQEVTDLRKQVVEDTESIRLQCSEIATLNKELDLAEAKLEWVRKNPDMQVQFHSGCSTGGTNSDNNPPLTGEATYVFES